MKETLKREFEALKLNKFTLIAAACAVVLAVVMCIIECVGETTARNGAWMFFGVGALAGGLVVYVHYILVDSSKLSFYASIFVFACGVVWLVGDIFVNGSIGSTNQPFAGWWLGLIIGVVVAAIMYFLPGVIRKYLIKK